MLTNYKCYICESNRAGKISGAFAEKYVAVKCSNCQGESVYPLPSVSELEEYYRNYYYGDFNIDDSLYQGIINYLVEQLEHREEKENLSFLDYGFGEGNFLKQVAKNGFSAYGVEFSSAACEAMQAYCQQNSLQIQWIKSPEDSLEKFAGKKFNFITLFQVIEHIVEPLELIKSLSALQLPGGYLYIECPNNDAFYLKFKNALRKKTGREMFFNSLNPPQHVHGFNRHSLKVLLERAGYTPIEIKDYAYGDGLHQVETSIWYPSLLETLKNPSRWNFFGFSKSIIGEFDPIVSKLFKAGGGLYAVARKNSGC